MSQLTKLIQSLRQPLAIEPLFLQQFVGVIGRKLAGERFSGADLHAELGIQAAAGRREASGPPHLAVIPIQGVVARHAHSMGASTKDIAASTRAAVNARGVDGILYLVDSPGGTVGDVPETADVIREAGKVKPTLAMIDGLGASAGYWLAAAANEVWTPMSSDGVGSIGVYTLHEDWSENLAKEGVKVSAISAGKYKTEGAPWQEMSTETRDFLQAQVDEAYTWFVKDVARFRGDSQTNVRNGYGEGRVLGAEDALKAKLIDRIGGIDEALGRLESQANRRRGPKASVLRERLALDSARLTA